MESNVPEGRKPKLLFSLILGIPVEPHNQFNKQSTDVGIKLHRRNKTQQTHKATMVRKSLVRKSLQRVKNSLGVTLWQLNIPIENDH